MDLSYFFIFCLIFACTGLGSAHDDPIVETKLGKVRGLALHSVVGDDFLAFKGIPYAKPPVGELRFKVRSQVYSFKFTRPKPREVF